MINLLSAHSAARPAPPLVQRSAEDRRSWNSELPPYLTPEGWIWEDRRKQSERRLPIVEEILF